MANTSYMTGNTELAAALVTAGERLDSVKSNGSRAEFYFERSETLQRAISDFASNVPAPAKTLFENLRLMKSLAKDSTQSNQWSGRREYTRT